MDIHTSAREFIPIETLDHYMQGYSGGMKAFFTVGVVVENAGPYTSKSGKQFSIMKISDLVKYDLGKVKKHLQSMADKRVNGQGGSKDEATEFIRTSEKSFNSNGYKALKVMAF